MAEKTTLLTRPTRNEAILAGVDLIQSELLPGDTADLVVCLGPPECDAEKEIPEGCRRCLRITVGEELARA